METNYELKHKCLLVPLKVVLLVLAMLVGFTTYAQQGKIKKVANDQQLIEAMDEQSISVIELEAGYYAYLDIQAESGTKVVKQPIDNGSRTGDQCTYFIVSNSKCFTPAPDGLDLLGIQAGTSNASCPPANPICCPPTDPPWGTWLVVDTPSPTAVATFLFPSFLQVNFVQVNEPGIYTLAYEWDDPSGTYEYAYVETEYYFYGPKNVELSAPDVCDDITEVSYDVDMPVDFVASLQWLLNGEAYSGPTADSGSFFLDEDCGYYELSLIVRTVYEGINRGCPDTTTIYIDIACQPIADAGPDLWVCDDLCAYSLYGSTGIYTYSPTHAWSWVQVSGPSELTFLPDNEMQLEVGVCADELDECPYGEYEVEFQVQNGLCYDEDNTFVRFYEQPEANAGIDQVLCNTFSFTLTATPYEYCGEEGVNYWPTRYWEFFSSVDPNAQVTFFPDEFASEVFVTITTVAECPFGTYTFAWHEENSKYEDEGCLDVDYVNITVFESPEVDAGADLYFCDTFEFTLDGTLDMQCNTAHAYTYSWELIDQPDMCEVSIAELTADPLVSITNCSPCEYGEYIFKFTQQNGYYNAQQEWVMVCEDSDEVSVWIFEEPFNVDAGPDQDLCNEFDFTLTGSHDAFCGDAGVNNFVWYTWNLISQPDDCEVAIINGETLTPYIWVDNCNGPCPYGEYVFEFGVMNGFADEAYCEAYDLVTVTIFEQPEADAGGDVQMCVDIDAFSYCYTMTATMDYCYTMHGEWTKSCGPGLVTFDDPTDPNTLACFPEPGRYKFVWTVTSTPGCVDSETVTFDLLEQPVAYAEEDMLIADCDATTIDLELAGVDKYMYVGDEYDPTTGTPECPNYWDNAYWSLVEGPGGVLFADDTDPNTEMAVTIFGCYTVRWTEVNKQVDEEFTCEDYVDIFVVFVETPDPFAGDDASFCGPCYTMDADPYLPANCLPAQAESYWELIDYIPPVDPCLLDQFAIPYYPMLEPFDVNDPNANICVVDDCLGSHYGTYVFQWVNASGFCIGYDTVSIEFKKVPEEVALYGYAEVANSCSEYFGYYMPVNGYGPNGECDGCYVECFFPEDGVIEVCAESCLTFNLDWWCSCYGMPIPGYTYEWSFIGPAGSTLDAEPYWYDCDEQCWKGDDYVHICFGECCDTARLYLTITTPQGCTTTEEWKFYVNHKPCAEIEGPEVAEVGMISTYCNVCPEEFDMDCLLYQWTAEHCGEIVSGQGTECIEVLWTDYNVNGGWGQITLTTFDTCTGCCNYDEMMVKIHPAGTLGDATLSGYVYYDNSFDTPLNGVEITLWNGNYPVMTTTSFTDVEGGNGPGYYEFANLNGATEFGVTAAYDAMWYGANATDALAVELKAINNLPGGFIDDALAGEAMDVNNSTTINGTDALWIKQRAISMVNYFPAGDWVFEPGMTTTATTFDIPTLNAGDANRSNVPNVNPAKRAIDLLTNGTINVVEGQVFELPIQVVDAEQFGAITLSLEYNPALIEVVDVIGVEGTLTNISNGNVMVAWSNVNPMTLAANDVVMTLKVKAISEIPNTESLFSIGFGSEFADASAKVIEPVNLKTLGITTSPAAVDYFLSTNRPNPFSTSTFIEYTMPESGKVRLSVLDMLGQEIAVLVDATQSAGSYTVEFSAAGLATGVYMYKITVDGESRDFISTQRMVISH